MEHAWWVDGWLSQHVELLVDHRVDVVSLVYYPRVRVLLAQNHQRRCRERRAMIARRDDELAQAFTLAAEQIRARRKLSTLNERYNPRTLEVLSRLVDSD